MKKRSLNKLMEANKVLHTGEINWYEEDENYLDYDLVFNGKGYKKTAPRKGDQEFVEEPRVDVKSLIQKRDEKWEKLLEKAREEAFADGRKTGYEEGVEEAKQAIDDKLNRFEALVEKAHQDWIDRHQMLNPGLLDLVFDIVEKIVGLPVENPKIREQLEDELSVLLHATDDDIKPRLWVNEKDYSYIEEMVEKYAPELSLTIQKSEHFNPGEFEFETEKETVVHRFRENLAELKDNLTLPSWK